MSSFEMAEVVLAKQNIIITISLYLFSWANVYLNCQKVILKNGWV